MSGGLIGTVAPSGAEAAPVTDIEGAEDIDDTERRGVEDVGGTAGVDDVGRVNGRDVWS